MAGALALERIELAAHDLEVVQGRLHVPEQPLARGVQAHAVRHPVEQLAAELVLKLQDLPVDRARCDVQVLGGLPHRAATGHLDEVLQDAGVHGQDGPVVG